MNRDYYDALVDGAKFEVIAGYLASPRSPIQFLLHLKSREQLAKLAEAINEGPDESSNRFPGLPRAAERLLHEGAMKVSSRLPLDLPDPTWTIDPSRVRRDAGCYVIYEPPYYLVYTPGLFEGLVLKPELPQKHKSATMAHAQKPLSREKDHEHGY